MSLRTRWHAWIEGVISRAVQKGKEGGGGSERLMGNFYPPPVAVHWMFVCIEVRERMIGKIEDEIF